MGTEADLRRRVRAELLLVPLFAGDCTRLVAGGVFAALAKAFSEALITCVARAALSFGLVSLAPWHASPAPLTGFLVVERLVLALDWPGFREDLGGGFEDSSMSCLPWSSSFKEADIAGVHVDTDTMADRIASACAVKDAIGMCTRGVDVVCSRLL